VRILRTTLLLLAVLVSSAHAQTAGRGSIQGALVKWGTSEPVDQATIELRDASGSNAIAVTASRSDGQFEFANVPPGTYRIVALGIGYATSEYGQLRQNGSGRTIRIGGERTRIQMGMVPGGVLSGRVTDQNGRGLVYANVQLFKSAYSPEGLLAPTLLQQTITNDLGEYRFFWLAPGRYLVNSGPSTLSTLGLALGGTQIPTNTDATFPTTSSSPGRPRPSTPPVPEDGVTRFNADATVYYANSRDAQGADVIELRSGDEVAGINIRVAPLDVTNAAVQIRGVVLDPSGAPAQGNYSLSISSWPNPTPTTLASVRPVVMRIPPPNPQQFGAGAQIYANDNGKFDGAALHGKYEIRASQRELSGRVVLDAGSRDLDVSVPLRGPTSVSGRVVIEGADAAASKASLEGLLVGIRTAPAYQFFSGVGPDGRFKIESVIPGDFQIYVPPVIPAPAVRDFPNPNLGVVSGRTDVAALQNAYVKSIRVGAVDLKSGSFTIEGNEPAPELEITIALSAACVCY
jgi:hypothetical protein